MLENEKIPMVLFLVWLECLISILYPKESLYTEKEGKEEKCS